MSITNQAEHPPTSGPLTNFGKPSRGKLHYPIYYVIATASSGIDSKSLNPPGAGDGVRTRERTLQGIETVNIIRKGQIRWLAKDDIAGAFISSLFRLALAD